MHNFHPADFRAQFPALREAGVYLDSAATTLKPQCLIDATTTLYSLSGGTVHRSHYTTAQELTARYEQTRAQVARWINASDAHSIVWTRGATEAINLVAKSWLEPQLHAGDEIIVSETEHHANLVPWLMLAQTHNARLIKLPLGSDLLPDLSKLPKLLNSKTRVLALGQMSNVTGGQPQLKHAIEMAHQVGAKVMIDGAQGIVHARPDMQALDIDFYAFSGHKFYGPTGLGVLYAKPELLEVMSPWHGGGKMLTKVDFNSFTLQPPPWRFEAGTPNVAGVVGLSATLDWLAGIDMKAAERWSCKLADIAEEKLATLSGFRSFRASNASLFSFEFAGLHHHDLVTLLAESGVAIRAGQHCAQPLMQALGVSGTLRASFAPYNTLQDVETLVRALRLAINLLEEN